MCTIELDGLYMNKALFLLSFFFVSNICFAKEESFQIKSSAFKENAFIPKLYTCTGGNISPPLSWENIPLNAESLALIVDDPDAIKAAKKVWVHWVMYNIPAMSKGLQRGVLPVEELAHTAKQGLNTSQNIGYEGPCPPDGPHRYFFKLYALDTKLNIEGKAI